MNSRRVIFVDPELWKENNTVNNIPIRRPLTPQECHLLRMLAVAVVAHQGNCPQEIAAQVLDQYAAEGAVSMDANNTDAHLRINGDVIVHATRDWLAFHAEHPEAIDPHRHARVIRTKDEEER